VNRRKKLWLDTTGLRACVSGGPRYAKAWGYAFQASTPQADGTGRLVKAGTDKTTSALPDQKQDDTGISATAA